MRLFRQKPVRQAFHPPRIFRPGEGRILHRAPRGVAQPLAQIRVAAQSLQRGEKGCFIGGIEQKRIDIGFENLAQIGLVGRDDLAPRPSKESLYRG